MDYPDIRRHPGQKWTSRQNSVIHTYSSIVFLNYKERLHRIISIYPADKRRISENSISYYGIKKIPLRAIFIRPFPENEGTEGPEISQDMENTLKKYADFFPKKSKGATSQELP